ncbi:prenyltransferase/squalene oxidase repeat-containing protein [Brevibacillus laterosporus]|uniref:prenyltransferase/squalene oxidase repeat-containing protein n=1 Tax=Brevibacillus laterosporus TaxID=1465 RepID=UPI000B9C479C|nr:prenyltransferase/squalene oxidase repeat-containing protein [Brevibacillus laterosporus]
MENIKIISENDLLNLKYIIDISDMLQLEFDQKFKESIIENLLTLEIGNGMYAFSPNDSLLDIISTTELVVECLNKIQYSFDTVPLSKSIIDILEKEEIEKINTKFKPTLYNSALNILHYINYKDIEELLSIKKLKNTLTSQKMVVPISRIELYNAIAISKMKNLLKLENDIQPEFKQYLESIRLKDGGFNFLTDDLSDLQTTLEINRIYKDVKFLEEILQNTKKFQKDSGGFSVRSIVKNSNTLPTLMGYKILNDLGYDDLESLKKYLNDHKEEINWKNVYQMKDISKEMNYKPNIPEYNEWNIDLLYKLVLTEATENEKELINKELKESTKEFWTKKDVEETFLITKAKKDFLLNIEYKVEDIKYWALSSQNNDGGFSTKGTESDLIETYFYLQILKESDIEPTSKESIANYIFSLRVPSGGYTFQKGGNASLQATYYSIESLKLLNITE